MDMEAGLKNTPEEQSTDMVAFRKEIGAILIKELTEGQIKHFGLDTVIPSSLIETDARIYNKLVHGDPTQITDDEMEKYLNTIGDAEYYRRAFVNKFIQPLFLESRTKTQNK